MMVSARRASLASGVAGNSPASRWKSERASSKSPAPTAASAAASKPAGVANGASGAGEGATSGPAARAAHAMTSPNTNDIANAKGRCMGGIMTEFVDPVFPCRRNLARTDEILARQEQCGDF
jgi:hypothetical protein